MKFLKFIFKMILTIVIAAILGCAAIVGYSVYVMNQEKTEREEIADSGEESTEITATPVISEGSAEESMENSAGDSTTVETVSDDVIREDFKKMLDDYEEFMDEYIEFMRAYDASDATLLAKYMSLLSEYAEFTQSIEALEEEEMTDAEAVYYLEVTSRVTQKLTEAAIEIS